MARAISFIEKHLSLCVMAISLVSMIIGMWAAVNANSELTYDKRSTLEGRVIRVETKVDMILQILKSGKGGM